MKKIAILLSSYNGEKFLKEQLDSIMEQSYQNFILYIRDDGSSDNTVSIIKKYKQNYSKQITFIEDDKGNLGVRKSFEETMKKANADYYFFCDQDDVWHNKKLELLINELSHLQKNNPNEALLVYSSFTLIDGDGNEISSRKHLKASLLTKKINNGAFRNLVPGCFMAFNKKAKKLYLLYSNYVIHDELLFILTSIYGKINNLNIPLIQYRLHENNTIGLQKKKINWSIYFKDILKYIFNNEGYRNIVLSNYFSLVENIRINQPLQKEFYTKDEVNKLSWFSRKKWFYQHFFLFNNSDFFKDLKELLLI